jgi:hypothetical protein
VQVCLIWSASGAPDRAGDEDFSGLWITRGYPQDGGAP